MAAQYGRTSLAFGQLLYGDASGNSLGTFTTAKHLSFADETSGLGDTAGDVTTIAIGGVTANVDTTNKGTLVVPEDGYYEIEASINCAHATIDHVTLEVKAGASFAALASFANTAAGFYTPPQIVNVTSGDDTTTGDYGHLRFVAYLPAGTVIGAYVGKAVSEALTVFNAKLSVKLIA